MAEPVITRALFLIGKHGISLGRFLELILGFLIARILVGVILQRQLSIRLLDLFDRRRASDAEDLVVIPFLSCRHCSDSITSRKPVQPASDFHPSSLFQEDGGSSAPLGRLD